VGVRYPLEGGQTPRFGGQGFDVEEPGKEAAAVLSLAVVDQLVDQRLAARSLVRQDVLEEIIGVWYDRSKAYRMRLAGLDVLPKDWIVEETIQLTPLPALARLSPKRQIALVRRLVFESEQEARLDRTRGCGSKA
jgi:hypothetical protein